MADNTDKEGWETEKETKDLIAEAKAFWQEDLDYEQTQRELMLDDQKFALGELESHFDGGSYATRIADSRPMIVVNRMNEFLMKVKNEQRQNKPSIKVSPAGAISKETQKQRLKAAENRQGLIRHIQYDSKAQEAYQTAFDNAVDTGRGFYLIKTDYVAPDSFNQKIMIERIPDALTVVPDRNRKEIDYSDMKRCGIGQWIPRERFKSEFPDAIPSQWVSRGSRDNWVRKDDLFVLDYYCIKYKVRTLYGLEDGRTFYNDELKQFPAEDAKDIKAMAVHKRKSKEPYVKFYKMTSTEILEEKDIVGKYIPIVPVVIVEKEVDGELVIKGMVRDLKPMQRMYDFWVSTEAELLTLAPKAPYIAADGQLEGYEKYWESANKKAWAVLPYKPVSLNGTPVPPPQRTDFAQVPIGVVNAKASTIDDMRAVTGIHEQSLGMTGPERSGRAIIALQRSGDNSTYNYTDAMAISITQAGRIINGMLPFVYDTDRIEKILGAEDNEEMLELGGLDEDGDRIELGSGEFDIVCSMGPSYLSRRQESADGMLQFMQAVPNVVPLVYDLLVKNMDWPGAEEISERLRKTIPPEILEEQGGERQMAMQLQKMMMQVKQYEELIPMLSQQLEKAMAQLDDKGAEISKDIEVANIKAATDIAVAQIRSNTERSKTYTNALMSVRKQNTPQGA